MDNYNTIATNSLKTHSFHIPVMGIGFTIDTPLKVSKYGIDSVISLVDDILLEKLRKMYCDKFNMQYIEISEKIEDFRAKRITSYLDMVHSISNAKFDEFKNTTVKTANSIKSFFDTLSDMSSVKQEFKKYKDTVDLDAIKSWVKDHMVMGSIDVNIMTKVDKENYIKKEKLPTEYNDAHAALRGFANSTLSSSVILSAGMNPRLYSYLENFEDFYPDANGNIKKKIVLKVSDYRSALIQGKFLAKKGLWVSEYRIESGLNCGGHAFATDGYLMGPILEQFKINRNELIETVHKILVKSLSDKNKTVPTSYLQLKISAQGGVGTAEEHQFIVDYYNVDSVGWGSPFLLVPEATTVDKATLNRLKEAKEEDLYLSNTSPLGVPFHSLKGNTKDQEKQQLINKGRPGSSCPKKFVALNKDFSDKGICTASREYQYLKIKDLDKEGLSSPEYQLKYNKIIEKSCTCVGLGTSALLAYGLDTKTEGDGVSVCPGPNMAYFSKEMNLSEMIDHIYGKANVIARTDRPNVFIKELGIYIKYVNDKLEESKKNTTDKQRKYLNVFLNNLKEGALYYQTLFTTSGKAFKENKDKIIDDLHKSLKVLEVLELEVKSL
ncbi:hypothetical protein [Cellulophaga fucicola]|uniref:Uncharacterized protein n=1 Tax=Cellulophaga fucicola TaxID=76595 RepID=A0A1K1P5Z3_9FLAO|nr:hypothetical protein [Cellulophaga fucicola]SFW42869.1 hypothetical protein SAMN05660313_01628 [Cellulophaga fucicola]